jgi:hypothetical protein
MKIKEDSFPQPGPLLPGCTGENSKSQILYCFVFIYLFIYYLCLGRVLLCSLGCVA